MTDQVGPPEFGLEPRRQWWGVHSVRAHMNPLALAREILLYDRLVLPTPEDEAEADRWDHHGWDTYRLAYVADHLGDDLVHLVPWNSHMRHLWQDHMRMLAAAGTTSEGAAYGATPLTMVDFIWNDVQRYAAAQGVPPVPPRIVAAYLSRDEAMADFGVTSTPSRGVPPAGREAGLLLTRLLEIPDGHDAEDVFLNAVRLAREPGFVARRRALYDYEDRLVAEDRSRADITSALERLLDSYNEAVRDHAGRTVRQQISRLLVGGGGALVNHLLPGSGAAVKFGLTKVFARFPSFNPGPDPNTANPGAALGRVSAAFPGSSKKSP